MQPVEYWLSRRRHRTRCAVQDRHASEPLGSGTRLSPVPQAVHLLASQSHTQQKHCAIKHKLQLASAHSTADGAGRHHRTPQAAVLHTGAELLSAIDSHEQAISLKRMRGLYLLTALSISQSWGKFAEGVLATDDPLMRQFHIPPLRHRTRPANSCTISREAKAQV